MKLEELEDLVEAWFDANGVRYEILSTSDIFSKLKKLIAVAKEAKYLLVECENGRASDLDPLVKALKALDNNVSLAAKEKFVRLDDDA